MRKVEILAPAGDYECFLAAIKSGADAVYLGGNFSARAYAKNFSDEEILSAIDYAHFHNRKVYMTLNIVMKQEEIDTIIGYISPFYEAGLDGVIVQDIGLIDHIRRNFENLPVHASTQMTITGAEGVKLLENKGVSRVVLARELSLDEISYIHSNCDAEIECFIHGALCYSYSGKCFMSSILGGRSGNRGRCAGTCRLPFDNEYILSCKDICTLNIIPQLINAGISSFKIEGRMKSAEYVAGVVGIYRKYVDLYYSTIDDRKNYCVDKEDLDNLLTLYTRSGNCEGYYNTKNGRDMITLSKSGYASADDKLSQALSKQYIVEDIDKSVDMFMEMKLNKPAKLTVSCDDYCVTVISDELVSKAINRPLLKEDVYTRLKKTGGSGFCLGDINLTMDDDVFISLGKLNEIRRDALTKLKESMLNRYRRKRIENFCDISRDMIGYDISDNSLKLHVYTKTLEQVLAAQKCKTVDMISVDYYVLINNPAIFHISENASIYVILPSVIRRDFFDRNSDKLSLLLNNPVIRGVVVDNYEMLYYLSEIGYGGEIISDIHLYVLNREAVYSVKELGVSRTTTPVELNKAELLRRNIPSEDMIVYGYLPLMVSAQCVNKTKYGCDRMNRAIIMTDRYNKRFTAKSECEDCLSTIYNSVPLSLHKDINLARRLNASSVRLMFSTENSDQVIDIIHGFSDLIYNDKEYNPEYEYTRGHLLRGVE